jgi:hypothetical protein
MTCAGNPDEETLWPNGMGEPSPRAGFENLGGTGAQHQVLSVLLGRTPTPSHRRPWPPPDLLGLGQRMQFSQLRRREFISLLGCGCVAARRAQQAKKLPTTPQLGETRGRQDRGNPETPQSRRGSVLHPTARVHWRPQ